MLAFFLAIPKAIIGIVTIPLTIFPAIIGLFYEMFALGLYPFIYT